MLADRALQLDDVYRDYARGTTDSTQALALLAEVEITPPEMGYFKTLMHELERYLADPNTVSLRKIAIGMEPGYKAYLIGFNLKPVQLSFINFLKLSLETSDTVRSEYEQINGKDAFWQFVELVEKQMQL